MKVTKQSMFSGKTHTLDLEVTEAQMQEWLTSPRTRVIQDIFPNLTPSEREFLMTGVTAEEWDSEFKPKTWMDMAERLPRNSVIRMTRSIVCGFDFHEGSIFTVIENNLNEMEPCLILADSGPDQWFMPGPGRHDSAEWDELAPFEIIRRTPDGKDEQRAKDLG